MQAAVCVAVLCIGETGDAHVILKSFPCGQKSRPLSIVAHKDAVSSPVQRDELSLRITQNLSATLTRNLNFAYKEKVVGSLSYSSPSQKGLMREQRSQPPDRPAKRTEIQVKFVGSSNINNDILIFLF